MNFNYLILDDFFSSDELLETLSISSEIIYNEPGINYYKGVRSPILTSLYPEFTKKLIKKLYKLPFARNTAYKVVDASFHKMTNRHLDNYSLEESAWHCDPSTYAGVVYLNENPDPKTGTLLKLDDKIIEIENKFNRGVFYRADIMHRVADVKSNIEDPRLTMVIFIDAIIFAKRHI